MSPQMSLAKAVVRLRLDLLEKDEEIRRLRKQLRPLRRKLAFLCHPDRGGDPETMKEINRLFDSIGVRT